MRHRFASVSRLVVPLLIVACSGGADDHSGRELGQFEFDSPAQTTARFTTGAPEADDSSAPGNDVSPSPSEQAPERAIEESDIWKLDQTTLYVLNRYRGLQIIDVSNPDAPRLVGRAPIYGWPREMYVRDGKAYVIVSDYYTWWSGGMDDEATPGGWRGSQIRVVDLSNLERPLVTGSINIDGDVTDSRIVGDVLYVVSRRYAWYWNYETTDTESTTAVLSIDVGNPADVRVVDSKSFPMGANAWEQHIGVSSSAIYIATPDWSGAKPTTHVRYVDISSPRGEIVPRGEAVVPGRVHDRWAFDEFDGALRVASGEAWGNGDIYLTTWDATKPDALPALGKTTLRINERLTAARFAGNRGYLVSFRNIDPLYSFDLSNPAAPKLIGELEMSGWLDFIQPFGDRLVALGHDDAPGSGTSGQTTLAVSLIDVAGEPKLLSRVHVGDGYGWVPGSRDDFAKVFKALPEEELVVFPFQDWNPRNWTYSGGAQLIDWRNDALTRRGIVEGAGWMERAIPLENDMLITLSNEAFALIDISDRDNPRVRGSLELARNVQHFALLGDEHAVQFAGDLWRGDARLVVTHRNDPDTTAPLASLDTPAPNGRMWTNGGFAYVAGVRDGAAGRSQTRIDVIDLTAPASPTPRGHVLLPVPAAPGQSTPAWGYGDEAVQVGGSTLAFHRYHYDGWYEDCFNCNTSREASDEIHIVDASKPEAPLLAATLTLPGANWSWGLRAVGNVLYLSEYKLFMRGDVARARYYLRRVDATAPAQPTLYPPVNIPGYFVGASPDGKHIYTLESSWQNEVETSRLYALELTGDRAYLRGWVDVDGYVGNLVQSGTTLWATVQKPSSQASGSTSSDAPVVGGGRRNLNRPELVSFTFADPASPRVDGRVTLPVDSGWLIQVADGRAFVEGGPGLFTFDVTNSAKPTFDGFHRTSGWIHDVVTQGKEAWLPSGQYGVQRVSLP